MTAVLFALAVVLAVVGVATFLQGQVLRGILLLALAAAIGPGGWSIGRR